MSNAVFTASESSAYDDQIEVRYHFPSTYLKRVTAALGDYIIYYEPRRATGPTSSTGRQAYFATARVKSIEADRQLEGHYYAHMADFIEFDRPIPFREEEHYFEASLRKDDGSTNKGMFGRAVRLLPPAEARAIVHAGFATPLDAWDRLGDDVASPSDDNRISDEVPEQIERPTIERIVTRKVRDIAFRRHVRNAYQNTCAATGLRLINGGGRPEVQAAHIRPVEADGPDTIRNGIALTGTAHWLFDRGMITFTDDYQILLSPHGVPESLDRLIHPDRRLVVPEADAKRPHPTYLKWHREHRFKS